MKKVQITADGILSIVKSILADEDVNVINDPNAPEDWRGKTITELLNVEYYTFKYRPASTEQIIADLKREGAEEIDLLMALRRGFCCFVLGEVVRQFTKDADTVTVEGSLDYWIQTDKIKILEYLIDKANTALSGLRIPIGFPEGEVRRAIVVFDPPVVPEIEPESSIGEAVQCSVGVNIILSPDVLTYSDYLIEVAYDATEGADGVSAPNFKHLPVTNVAFDTQMNQKGVPLASEVRRTGVINLSRGRTLKLAFEGYNIDIVNWLAQQALSDGGEDNNAALLVRITRNGISVILQMVVVAHSFTVSNSIENETHSLTLAERGIS